MADKLSVTLIDVGWGDSIFIEHIDNNKDTYYALIDSNDEIDDRTTEIFLKKYFLRNNIKYKDKKPFFDFIMISHWHHDHFSGIKKIMKTFGTKRLIYPKTKEDANMNIVTNYADKHSDDIYLISHESTDTGKKIEDFGNVTYKILWPLPDKIYKNENNNSIVLKMTLGKVNFILTGDAEASAWNKISKDIPKDTKFFKVPHHGSINGTIIKSKTPWLDRLNSRVSLGISGHITEQYIFPRDEVIKKIENKNIDFYRTDNEYHLTFSTNGDNNKKIDVQYSRI